MGIILFGTVLLLFIPINIKIEGFFDVLNGRFYIRAVFPTGLKKTVARGAHGEDGLSFFLFGRKLGGGRRRRQSGTSGYKSREREKEAAEKRGGKNCGKPEKSGDGKRWGRSEKFGGKNRNSEKGKKSSDEESRKQGKRSKKRSGKKKRKFDIPLALRRLEPTVVYLDILCGGEDFVKFLFLNMFISNIIKGYEKAIEEIFNIGDFSANLITCEGACLKIKCFIRFKIFAFKIFRIASIRK